METALTPAEKATLAQIQEEELRESAHGIVPQPVRFKINKETQQFQDALGMAHDELRGIIVYKEIARGHWQPAEKNPLCSGVGGLAGVDREGKVHTCADCPHNQWGSGKEGTGKACKEMRRVYVMAEGSPIPFMLSLPPTSIRIFDSYISGRIQQGIPDLMAETVFRLVPLTSGKYTVAGISPKIGTLIRNPGEIMRLRGIRNEVKAYASRMAVTAEDYETEAAEVEKPEKPATGDVF